MKRILILFGLFLLGTSIFAQKIENNLQGSYFGNSFPGGPQWVQNFVQDMGVDPDGTVRVFCDWDEAGRRLYGYKNCGPAGSVSARPNSRRVVDNSGKTWTIENFYARFMLWNPLPVPQGDKAPYILCSDGRKITTILDPTALAINNEGHLMVADNGPDQNIKVFNIAGDPLPIDTIGAVGGIFSGTPGKREPFKFYAMRGIGVDASGTMWVGNSGFPSQQGGADLQAYGADGELECSLISNCFVNSADADPQDETAFYLTHERIKFDYDKPTGNLQQHWSFEALTINPFLYPDDPRITLVLESVFIRRINGEKFMFLTDMYAQFLAVFRFDGEIAVPAAFFCVKFDGQWDKYPYMMDRRPKYDATAHPGRRWLWRDANGDGQVTADEFSIYDIGGGFIEGIDIDADGNIWFGGPKLLYIPIEGIDNNGVPIYNTSSFQLTDSPLHNREISRIKYVDETRMMFMGTAAGEREFSSIIMFKDWEGNEGTRFRELKLPFKGFSFTADDRYLYVARGGPGGFHSGITGEINIWEINSGKHVGYLVPGPEVHHESGWIDIPYALNVFRRSNGERVLLAEEDAKGKILVYRWNPSDDPITDGYVAVGAIAPEQIIAPGSPVNIPVYAEHVNGIEKIVLYDGNIKLAELDAEPYEFMVNNLPKGKYLLNARLIPKSGATIQSETIPVNIGYLPPQVRLTEPHRHAGYAASSSIIIKADASVADGKIVKVEFFNGNTLLGTDTIAPFSFTWNNMPTGEHVLRAKATDNHGVSVFSQTLPISVGLANLQLEYWWGIYGTVLDSLYLDPRYPNSPDSVGLIQRLDIPINFRDNYGTRVRGYIKPKQSGNYTFWITSDDEGAFWLSTDESKENLEKIAWVGDGLWSGLNEWTKFPSQKSKQIYLTQGSKYYFEMHHTDGTGGDHCRVAWNIDNNPLQIIESEFLEPYQGQTVQYAPQVSFLAPSSNSRFSAGTDITVKVDAVDPDGQITKVELYNGEVLLGTKDQAPFTFVLENMQADTLQLKAIAYDNSGLKAEERVSNIIIGNLLPLISITSPEEGATLPLNVPHAIQTSASDPDGTISKVKFYVNDQWISDVTAEPFEFQWVPTVNGFYKIHAVAVDNSGDSSISNFIIVLAGNRPPQILITSPAEGILGLEPEVPTIKVETSDYNGFVSRVEYFVNDEFAGKNEFSPFWFKLGELWAGNYNIRAVAYDNDGASSEAFRSFTVIENLPPVVNITSPSDGATFQADDRISIRVNASDPDGTISKVTLYINDVEMDSKTILPYTFTWNIPKGVHVIYAKAIDNKGRETVSDKITLEALPTSVAEISQAKQLLSYPNPLTDNSDLIVELPETLNGEYFKFEIYDLEGRLVYRRNSDDRQPKSNQIVVANSEWSTVLKKGLYIIKVVLKENILTHKISVI